ncbi:MAG: hypothetical protein K1W22_00790 [Lachnospiraceae bacterium]
MVNPKNLSQYVGFTEEEVRRLCVAYDMDYDNYWGQTESYESLKEYICMNYDGPKDSIIAIWQEKDVGFIRGAMRMI